MENISDYIVTEVIGSGSFGTCYKVKHKTSLQEYVWKAVNYGQMSEEKKHSLVSEVNVLSKLQHPHIVRYYNHIIHQKSSTLYIIMEYCSGGDLSKVIKNCKQSTQQLNEVFIWRILYQISLALHVCHSQCSQVVVHRDIKPENVFLDADNNVKLGDFGLAKMLHDKDYISESIVGTPYFMSPELLQYKTYNKKTDIWAVGCLTYEICALKSPFNAKNIKVLYNKIKEGKYERIPKIYSDELQKIIDFMLNLNAENRPFIDVICRHPTVIFQASKTITSIYKKSNKADIQFNTDLESQFNENLQQRLENVRNRESALKIREEKLNEKERILNKRDKKIVLLERMANEKIARANIYLKTSRENKFNTNRASFKINKSCENLDTSFSADPGDNSILPTSGKIDEDNIVKPKGFVRSKSERRVHFNAQKIFQSTNENEVFIKEYNFFNDENTDPSTVQSTQSVKPKKKGYFARGVFKTLNSKISQSSTSIGSKSSKSSTSSELSGKPGIRPMSWTEENKKCAFSLLKIMNNENDTENIRSKITHTKM